MSFKCSFLIIMNIRQLQTKKSLISLRPRWEQKKTFFPIGAMTKETRVFVKSELLSVELVMFACEVSAFYQNRALLKEDTCLIHKHWAMLKSLPVTNTSAY